MNYGPMVVFLRIGIHANTVNEVFQLVNTAWSQLLTQEPGPWCLPEWWLWAKTRCS